MLRVRAVDGPGDLRSFIDLPYRLHRKDPCWAPPLRRDVRASLGLGNPFFEHGEAVYFLAWRGSRVVGRIAAISNTLHDETQEDGAAFFGFFECVDDQEVAAALFAAAEGWAAERGYECLRGPVSHSVNDECAVLVDGFNSPPTVMMTHNPPYYGELLEGVGCVGVKNLLAYHGGHPSRPQPAPERLSRGTRLLQKRLGVSIRPLDMGRLDEELELVRKLFNASWSDNWGFVPITPKEVDHLARSLKPVLIPELVPFAEIDGQPVGFGAAIPDVNQVLLSNRSGSFLPGVLRVFWARKRRKLHRLRILLVGVLPELRGRGLDAVLYHWIWTRGGALGFPWGEASWILEDNVAMILALEKMGFSPYKTYRLYEKALERGRPPGPASVPCG